MTLTRLRFVVALSTLTTLQAYGCGSSAISTGSGGDAAAGTTAAPVQGSPGSGGDSGGAGSGGAGSGGVGSGGHVGSAGSGGYVGSAGSGGHTGGAGSGGHTGGAGSGVAGATGAGGHAGATGAGGAGGASCTDLETQYEDALAAARSCTVGAAGQCQQSVSGSLSVCFSYCMTYVNDPTVLNDLKAQWQAAGCASKIPVACPAIACLQPAKGECAATDGGGGVCMSPQLGLQTN